MQSGGLAMNSMFNAAANQAEFLAKLARLDPFKFGLRAGPEELEGRAAYIKSLTKLVANHLEEVMADAAASVSLGSITEEDARTIEDYGADLAGQLIRAANLCEAA